MKLGISPLLVLTAQAFLVPCVVGQPQTVTVNRLTIQVTPVGRTGCSLPGGNVTTGTLTFNIAKSCTTASIGTVTLAFPAGPLTGTFVSGAPNFKLTSPSAAPFSLTVSTKLAENEFQSKRLRITDSCTGATSVSCQVGTLQTVGTNGGVFEAWLDESLVVDYLDSKNSLEEDQYDIRIWFTAAGCKTAAGVERSAAACPVAPAASIAIDTSLPKPGENLLAVADQLPPFFASGIYTYTGSNMARVYLSLLDKSGTVVAVSPRQDYPPGSGLRYGNDPSNYLFIAAQTTSNFNIPKGAKASDVLGTLTLQATLVDSGTGKVLATSAPIPYKVIAGLTSVTTFLVRNRNGDELKIDPTRVALVGGKTFMDSRVGELVLQNQTPEVRVDLDFEGSGATLDLLIVQSDGTTVIDHGSTGYKTVGKGQQSYLFDLSFGMVEPRAAAVNLIPIVNTASGQVIQLDPIVLNVDSLAVLGVSPEPKTCDVFTPANCLLAGTSANEIIVNGSVSPSSPGETVVRVLTVGHGSAANTTTTVLGFTPVKGQTSFFKDDIKNLNLASDVNKVEISYELHHASQPANELCLCSTDSVVYDRFTTPLLVVAQGAGSAVLNFTGGTLAGTRSALQQSVKSISTKVNLGVAALQWLALYNRTKNELKFLPFSIGAEAAASSNLAPPVNPDFVSLNSTWTFDPPIPHDGSFSSTISLNYSTSDFPDDPNFVESKLQVVSFDTGTGALHVYPTTVDTSRKTATALIDGLDRYFSLAVIGPFSQSQLALVGASTNYVLVNTGTQDATVGITPYTPIGQGTAAVSVLKAGRQQQGTSPGWILASPNPSTVEGAAWLDNGTHFAVTPNNGSSPVLLFTDVEYDKLTSTEIDLSNPSSATAAITVTLYGSDGSSQGTQALRLAPKHSLSRRVEGLFPSVKPGFLGYLTVTSGQALAGAGLQWTNTAASALTAQTMDQNSTTVTHWYVPQLGGPGIGTALHLVNTTNSAANLTLHAYGPNGAVASPNVSIKLAAGQQYSQSITALFGMDAATTGSLQIDSDTAGVFGDVLVFDSGFSRTFEFSLPLSQSRISVVLPYTNNQTNVYVFNPNSAAATVTVTPHSADGAAGSASGLSVPAFGRASLAVNTGSYVTVNSDRPIVAAGWLIAPSGTTAGYIAVAANKGSVGDSGGPPPQVSSVVNAASFQPTITRGSVATLFGSNLAGSTDGASSLPLPLSLAGAQVTVAGIPAPIFYASPTQINFQVPFEAPISGSALVVVTFNGLASAAVTATLAEYSPGVFSYARTASVIDPVIVHLNNQLVTPDAPAKPGEILIVYATGAGTFTAPVSTGGPSPSPGANAKLTPAVTVGGAPAQVLFAGLSPGFVGLMQINVQLPATLQGGPTLPLVVQFGNASSPAVNLNVVSRATATGNLAISFSPSPVPKGSDGKWTVSITVRETGGVGVTVTKFLLNGTDLTALIVAYLGTNHLAANTSATGPFAFTTNSAPVDVVLSLTGDDDAGHTGLTWTGTVRLLP